MAISSAALCCNKIARTERWTLLIWLIINIISWQFQSFFSSFSSVFSFFSNMTRRQMMCGDDTFSFIFFKTTGWSHTKIVLTCMSTAQEDDNDGREVGRIFNVFTIFLWFRQNVAWLLAAGKIDSVLLMNRD